MDLNGSIVLEGIPDVVFGDKYLAMTDKEMFQTDIFNFTVSLHGYLLYYYYINVIRKSLTAESLLSF